MVLVKDQLEFHRRMADRYAAHSAQISTRRPKLGFEELVAELSGEVHVDGMYTGGNINQRTSGPIEVGGRSSESYACNMI